MKLKMVRSSGNVFRDVGLPEDEAEHLKVRADLLIQIQETLKARGLTQTEAAKLLGATQPRVSDLVRGRIDLFSVDSLIDMLARLGVRGKVVVTSSKKRLQVA
jgi:predicted XRE-type DNA-binding protein